MVLIGLMHLYKAFCALDHNSFNIRSHFCVAGTESLGVLIDVVKFIPMISLCGVCLVLLCLHELCANSAIGKRALQLF